MSDVPDTAATRGAGTPHPPALAGLDVGSTHLKAVVCTPAGRVLGAAVRPTPHGEEQAVALRETALDTLAEAVAHAGRPPEAVGLTGMAETGVALDRAGRPRGPLLTWADPRGAEQAARLAARLGAPALHATTGVRPSGKAPLAKWCWLRENQPAVLTRTRVWAGAVDLLAHALTGQLATDPTFAQRTMAWDVHAARWDADLVAEAGLSTRQLPTVRDAGEPAGTVTPAAARRVPGLRAGVPVLVAGHDHPVGAWAAGVRDPGAVADSMGTAEAVLTLGTRPPEPAAALAEGMGYGRHVDGRHWFVMAGAGSCGALVEWYCARLLHLPDGEARHRAFGALLAAAGPGPTGLVIEPYLRGRSAPAPDPNRRLAVYGLGPEDGRERLALAVIEATAYQARWMTEVQRTLTGRSPQHVTLLGGPVAQPRWPRVKAAVTPWATHLLAEPRAPAVGAALLAGTAAGLPADRPLPTTRAAPGGEEDPAGYDTVYREGFLPRVRRPAT